MSFGPIWLLIIAPIQISYHLISHSRLLSKLGGITLQVKTTPRYAGLGFSVVGFIFFAAISISHFNNLQDAGALGWLTPEYYRGQLTFSLLGILSSLSGFVGSLIEAQIRENGIYAGHRVYTWSELKSYQVEDDDKVRIFTTQKTMFKTPREVMWTIMENKKGHIDEVLKLLEANGISNIDKGAISN